MSFASRLNDQFTRLDAILIITFVLALLALFATLIFFGPNQFSEGIGLNSTTTPEIDEPPSFELSLHGVERPFDVFVDPSTERIYVTDTGIDKDQQGRLVHVFDRRGDKLASLYPPGTTPANRYPQYVITGDNGVVYVSDMIHMGGCISMYDNDYSYLGTFTKGWIPSGMSLDSEGNLYVCNRSEHCVMVFDPQGNLINRWGKEGNQVGQFKHPHGIVVDGEGRVYVADSNNSRIQAFDAEGNPTNALDGGNSITGLTLPRGLALDSRGRLYVIDTSSHTVYALLLEQELDVAFSFGNGPGIGDNEFNFPNGLHVDGNCKRVYIADRANKRIQVWEYSGS